MVAFPYKLNRSNKPDPYVCTHCGRGFDVRTDLGGHVRKMHAGSLKYAAKRTKRDSRVIDRAVQGLSKSINIQMKAKNLDQLSHDFFKWKNGRMIASEREEQNGLRTQEMATDPAIIKRDKTAEKGRVRRIKVKVMKLLNKPSCDWPRLIGEKWIPGLEVI